jgi:hypothetical protein
MTVFLLHCSKHNNNNNNKDESESNSISINNTVAMTKTNETPPTAAAGVDRDDPVVTIRAVGRSISIPCRSNTATPTFVSDPENQEDDDSSNNDDDEEEEEDDDGEDWYGDDYTNDQRDLFLHEKTRQLLRTMYHQTNVLGSRIIGNAVQDVRQHMLEFFQCEQQQQQQQHRTNPKRNMSIDSMDVRGSSSSREPPKKKQRIEDRMETREGIVEVTTNQEEQGEIEPSIVRSSSSSSLMDDVTSTGVFLARDQEEEDEDDNSSISSCITTIHENLSPTCRTKKNTIKEDPNMECYSTWYHLPSQQRQRSRFLLQPKALRMKRLACMFRTLLHDQRTLLLELERTMCPPRMVVVERPVPVSSATVRGSYGSYRTFGMNSKIHSKNNNNRMFY